MEMDEPVTLADYLRTARAKAGISQRQLANRVGIDHSYLARLESGEWLSPSADVLQRIAEVLEISSVDLFAFIGVMPPGGWPELAPYLRAKYHLSDNEIRRMTIYLRRLEPNQTNTTDS